MKTIIVIVIIVVVVLAILLLAYSREAAPRPSLMNGIKSITVEEFEEEGGSEKFTIYPSGYIRFKGTPSGAGYEPTLKDGWYKVVVIEAYQKMFDSGVWFLENYPNGGDVPEVFGSSGGTRTSVIDIGDRKVAYNGNVLRMNGIKSALVEPVETVSGPGQTTVTTATPDPEIEKFSELSEEPKDLYSKSIVVVGE